MEIDKIELEYYENSAGLKSFELNQIEMAKNVIEMERKKLPKAIEIIIYWTKVLLMKNDRRNG